MLIGHKKQWDFLKNKFEANQLSHAYLFCGPDEIGKKKFALELIKLITSIDKDTHPDLFLVASKDEIPIAKIREVQQFLTLKPYNSPFKAVIIDQAEKMNQEAQSCFLKTLEEPKGKTILILISSNPDMLFPTILSRCQIVKFFAVGLKEIEKYLAKNGITGKKAEMLAKICEGKPGRLINFLLEPDKMEKEKQTLNKIQELCNLDLAEKFQYAKNFEGNFSDIINGFKKYFRQLLFVKMGIDNFSGIDYFPQPTEKLKSYSIPKLKQIIELAQTLDFRLLTTNANPKLALEILLLEV